MYTEVLTPTQAETVARSKAFRAKIARCASLVPTNKPRHVLFVPNTPYGVPKAAPKPPPPPRPQRIDASHYWHHMWFYDLVFNQVFSRKPSKASPPPPKRIMIDDIITACAEYYGVSRTDILSARRTVKVVRPRHVGYYLAKVLTLKSFPEIGRRFGGKDHSSVLSGIRKIDRLRKTDPALETELHAVAASVGGSLA